MVERNYTYIIVGGGLAGASAVQGIRERDPQGTILLLGRESFLPYERPPLTKGLWLGKKQVADLFPINELGYANHHVDLALGVDAVRLDAANMHLTDSRGTLYRFEKLLLATGGIPSTLTIPGSDLEGVCYYRYLLDYYVQRAHATAGRTAVVVGGGFIGSEIAAALNLNRVEVTMVFPEEYLGGRIFPADLGKAIQQHYLDRGVVVCAGDVPTAIERDAERFITHTKAGRAIPSDLLIVGIGITPGDALAKQAGLEVGNGIIVNAQLQSSNPYIYAAGDNACFPYEALGISTRIEHWDNALNQGKWAGRNMAGAGEPYHYMPYFFSDLFEFGYEAVGEVHTKLQTFSDWRKPFETGVIYYLQDGMVRGAMMCNVWGKVDAARALIRQRRKVNAPEELRGAISFG